MIRNNGNLRAVISTEISNKEDLKIALEKSAKIDEVNFVKKLALRKIILINKAFGTLVFKNLMMLKEVRKSCCYRLWC